MRIGNKQIENLKELLCELGLSLSDEQVQEAGIAIIRFVIAKNQQKQSNEMRIKDDKK